MFKFKIKAIGKNPAPRRGIFLKLSAISAVLLSAVCVFVYFNGPKTHYTGFLRLYYNFGYIFTPCPGRTSVYENEYIKFSYRQKGKSDFTETYSRNEKHPDDRMFLIDFDKVDISFLLFESNGREVAYYKSQVAKIIKTGEYEYCETREGRSSGASSLGSTPCDPKTGKVPAVIVEKAVKEGLTVDILPWLMRQKVDESRIKRVILSGNIRAVIFRNELYAFLPDGKLFEISRVSFYSEQYIPDDAFLKIFSEFWDEKFHPTTSPRNIYIPEPGYEKLRNCFWDSVVKTIEFKGLEK